MREQEWEAEMSLMLEQGANAPARKFEPYIATWIAAMWHRMQRRFKVRHTRRELEELPDWTLRDMGITRGEIYSLALGLHAPARDGEDRSWRREIS